MGRAEKYANVVDKYEEKLKEAEEKLSTTRELKFSDLQKEIDNSVTIADYEEMDNLSKEKNKKDITDTSEIDVEDVEVQDTDELDVVDEDTLEIIKTPPKKIETKKKIDTSEVKIIDEPTEELLAMDGEESDKDEDDLYLTRSMNPIKKRPKIRKVFKILLVLLLLIVIGLVLFFKFIKPLYFGIVNSDPKKVFDNAMDYSSDELNKTLKEYESDTGIVMFNVNAKIDSNYDNFGSNDGITYSLVYGYDPMSKKMLSSISVNNGEEYNNQYLMENSMVYQNVSSYDNYIQLDNYTNVLSGNEFYKNNKDSFDKLQKYITVNEYMYYLNNTFAIYKEYFKDDMFTKLNYKLEVKEESINTTKNTLTLKKEHLDAISKEILKKVDSDAKYKKVYDVFGDIIDTSKNSVIINVYTKLNNKIIGFDIEEDGFTTTYYYLINEKNNSYDLHFSYNNKKVDISRRGENLSGTVNGNEVVFEVKYKEDTNNNKNLTFDIEKNGKKYTGSLDLTIDKGSKKDTFEYKLNCDDKYFNATGNINYKVNKSLLNVDLNSAINPSVAEYNKIIEEYNNSFGDSGLYQKYESWYKVVTNPDMLIIK